MKQEHKEQAAALITTNNYLMHRVTPDKILDDNHVICIEDDEVVGVTRFNKSNWFSGLISHTCVRKDRRKTGVATQLLAMAESKLAEKGARIVMVTVRADNVAATRLFKKNGWVKSVGFLNKPTGRDIVVWLKVLL